jgi:hypothetical protein
MSEMDTDMRADLCSVEGCEEPQESRDLCRAHYEVWLANREKPTVTKSKRSYVLGSFRLPDREVDRAYLAGLIDGDGSITHRDTERKYWSIKIFMNDKEVIDWLKASVGGTTSSYLPKNRTKRSHLWHLSRQSHVRSLLLAISPYLRVHNKREKAREALTKIEERLRASDTQLRAKSNDTGTDSML